MTLGGRRVLLAQELGLGRWHAEALAVLGREVEAMGLEPWYALPDPAVAAQILPRHARILAAPHHMPALSRRRAGPSRSHADILADAGWDDPATLAILMSSWRALLDLIAPDFILADAAPTLGLAARSRVPVIAVGLGFTQPCAPRGEPLPALAESTRDERLAIEETLVGHLQTCGLSVDSLADALATPARWVTCLGLLDPFKSDRSEIALGPVEPLPAPLPPPTSRQVLCYLSAEDPRTHGLLHAIVQSGAPCRAYIRDASSDGLRHFASLGVDVSPQPLSMKAALRDASLVVHHGGAGTIHQTLAAGRPALILPRYLEQALNAQALVRRGLALVPQSLDPDAIGAALGALTSERVRGSVATQALVVAGEVDPQAAARVVASGVRLSGR